NQQRVANLRGLAGMETDQAMWTLQQSDIKRAGYLTALQRDVAAKVQGYQSDVIRKQGEKLLADINAEVAKTYQNIYVGSRQFLEQQRHSMVQESMQRSQLRLAEEAAARAANAQPANYYLNESTGLSVINRQTGEHLPGFHANNEDERKSIEEKIDGANLKYAQLEKFKTMVPSRLERLKPGSQGRKIFASQVNNMFVEAVQTARGLGGKEDADKLLAAYGGDASKMLETASPETIVKILQESQDLVDRSTNTYAKTLSRQHGVDVQWTPPKVSFDAVDTGPSPGDGMLQATKGVQVHDATGAVRTDKNWQEGGR